jgi:hypothetical protein
MNRYRYECAVDMPARPSTRMIVEEAIRRSKDRRRPYIPGYPACDDIKLIPHPCPKSSK